MVATSTALLCIWVLICVPTSNKRQPIAKACSNIFAGAQQLGYECSIDNNNYNTINGCFGTMDDYEAKKKIRIAFIGNSILYYNDSPRILQQMLIAAGFEVEQDSCLKGGATITSLWNEGNGMKHKFHSDAALINPTTREIDLNLHHDKGAPTVEALLKGRKWDFLIINDYTQGPAREDYRIRTIDTLKQHIVPLLSIDNDSKTTTIPVMIQTQAYRREKIKNTEDLGTYENFTLLLRDGVHQYARVLNDEIQIKLGTHYGWNLQEVTPSYARVAPVGEAYNLIRVEHPNLFSKLYSWDDFHPSPYGTWLQGCILYLTILGEGNDIPTYDPTWWNQSRYIMPGPDGDSYYEVFFPTTAEAELLRQIAIRICQH
jgi:hypothetical protein